MEKPVIADLKPMSVEMEKDEFQLWCSCGRTDDQPMCDGSHLGTDFDPVDFTASETGEFHFCMCRHSGNPPLCDGSHAALPAGDAGPGPAGDAPDGAEAAAPVAPPPAEAKALPTPRNTPEEPHVEFIHALAKDGLDRFGHHGPMGAMGVPRNDLPAWDDIQILTAQLARKPLMDDQPVSTGLVIGPKAEKPLKLEIPLFVSDMSFGALSEEAKLALARGAEMAGTGVCSGEGGMLPEEQEANSRYLYELGTARFGYRDELMTRVQAFHFKAGQAAKTGTGGHLPGAKVTARIAQVRGLQEGQDAVSPPTFTELESPDDFKEFADRVREVSGGIPVGFKLSANHIEQDLDFALEAGADYVILDGRGGGTGAAPLIFRDHISVPTLPALARARRHLVAAVRDVVTLIITGGLRVPADFVKAMCLGADGVALSNSALQAIGCVGARICHSNLCPAGIATQKEELRARLDPGVAAERLDRFLRASVELMKVLARACGRSSLAEFAAEDVTTWKKDVADLAGIRFAGP